MPKGINYDCSLFMNYCYAHVSDDLRTLEAVIHETQPPIYREAFNYIMRSSHVLKHFNMFIMSWTEFDKYCNWLFPLLNEVEKRIDISHYDTVQKRVYGYMAERLLNVYVRAHKIPVNSCPIIWFNDNAENRQSFFRMKIRHFLNALSFYFARLGRSGK